MLHISKRLAIFWVGIATVIYVCIGGMRSVIYTNFIHAIVKFSGIAIALTFALHKSGGIYNLESHMPESMFSWTSVGFGQIIAWFIAGIGSILATQYVIQAIISTSNSNSAQRACFYTSTLMIPFGIATSLIGICSAYLYPEIKSIDALPYLVTQMPTYSAAVVVIGLAGAMFGAISANTMACVTLAMKDFYVPFFNKEKDDKKSIVFSRLAIIVVGLVLIFFAVYADEILAIAFLGKALRATLAVLIIMCFYFPSFGSKSGAFWGTIFSVVVTISWYVMGNPLGINSSYFALICPIVAMALSHIYRLNKKKESCKSGA